MHCILHEHFLQSLKQLIGLGCYLLPESGQETLHVLLHRFQLLLFLFGLNYYN